MNCTGYYYIGCSDGDVETYQIYHIVFACLYGLAVGAYLILWSLRLCKPVRVYYASDTIALLATIHCTSFCIYHILTSSSSEIMSIMAAFIMYTTGHNFSYSNTMYFGFLWISIKTNLKKFKTSPGLGSFSRQFIIMAICQNLVMLGLACIIIWTMYVNDENIYEILMHVYWAAWFSTVIVILFTMLYYGYQIYKTLLMNEYSVKKEDNSKSAKELRNVLMFVSFIAVGGNLSLLLYAIFVTQIDTVEWRFILLQGFIKSMEYIIACYCGTLLIRRIKE